MVHFEWLWAFALLPVPLLVRFLIKPARVFEQAALRMPFIEDLEQSMRQKKRIFSNRVLLYLALLAWVLLVVAASRPQWLGEFAQMPVSGRDLMVALDISGSMRERDFVLAGRRVERLRAAKEVAGDFIERRGGDRIGLIVFGEYPYLQMPLSFDLKSVGEMLDNTFIGLAEDKKTAIGDAIGLALKRLKQYRHSNRVLILLTDGANNAGSLDPVTAATLAAGEGMKIYTIGIGADRATARALGLFRQRSDLDEKTLRTIATKTGGRYFRAKDTNELKKIYALLDRLEVIERDPELFQTRTSLYPWPLMAALLIALAVLLLRSGRGLADELF